MEHTQLYDLLESNRVVLKQFIRTHVKIHCDLFAKPLITVPVWKGFACLTLYDTS